jgi:hypothetical protein
MGKSPGFHLQNCKKGKKKKLKNKAVGSHRVNPKARRREKWIKEERAQKWSSQMSFGIPGAGAPPWCYVLSALHGVTQWHGNSQA